MRAQLVLTVLVALLLASCGLEPQSTAQPLDLELVRPDEENRPDSTGDTADSTIEFSATIYLVGDDATLVPVARELSSEAEPEEQLLEILESLLDGATDSEIERGLSSAVPATTEIIDATLDDQTVTVDLTDAFASIGGRAEVRAVGQLVVTTTTFPGAQRLSLLLEGSTTAVPLPDGALTEEAVTLEQFSSLLGSPEGEQGG